MKIFLTGRNLSGLRGKLAGAGLDVTDDPVSADLIIPYGGDGAMLGAERAFPGRLKFPIRDEETAPLCAKHSIENQISALKSGTLNRTDLPLLEGSAHGKKLYAINDVFIHNQNYVSAMRYKVWINGESYGREIVGDGVGMSTVHGSTAYYRSITHSVFRIGVGLAFSNSTEVVNHLVLPEDSCVRILILRGPCEMVADNSPDRIELNAGDEGFISLSAKTSPMLGMDMFMCPDCQNLRHSLRHSADCRS